MITLGLEITSFYAPPPIMKARRMPITMMRTTGKKIPQMMIKPVRQRIFPMDSSSVLKERYARGVAIPPHPFGKQAGDEKEIQWVYSVTTWGTREPRRRLAQLEILTKTILKRSVITADMPLDSTQMRAIVRRIRKWTDSIS